MEQKHKTTIPQKYCVCERGSVCVKRKNVFIDKLNIIFRIIQHRMGGSFFFSLLGVLISKHQIRSKKSKNKKMRKEQQFSGSLESFKIN